MAISRREFLKSSAQTVGSLAAYSYLFNPFTNSLESFAAANNKTLMCIFLRGGNDGLNTMVPYGDNFYYQNRPKLGIAESNVLKINNENVLGFNPNLTNLKTLFDQGRLAVFPAAHNNSLTFSHFDSQEIANSGITSKATTGWLNRALSTLTVPGSEKLSAVSLGFQTHELLIGDFLVTTFDNIDRFSGEEGAFTKTLQDLYNSSIAENKFYSDALIKLGQSTFSNIGFVREIANKGTYSPANGAQYGNNEFSRQMMNAARLIKETDVRAMTLDIGGFDTHSSQAGQHTALMKTLDTGLFAFAQDLGNKLDDVVVLLMTEFGRTVAENGSNGTDHGRATAWFAMGGVKGGLYGSWPGLAPNQLREERYLDHSIDIGNIILEAVSRQLGVTNTSAVLPAFNFQPIGYLS